MAGNDAEERAKARVKAILEGSRRLPLVSISPGPSIPWGEVLKESTEPISGDDLRVIDAALSRKPYLSGDRMGVEDMLLFAMVSNFFMDGEKYPYYRTWHQRMAYNIRTTAAFAASKAKLANSGTASSSVPVDKPVQVTKYLKGWKVPSNPTPGAKTKYKRVLSPEEIKKYVALATDGRNYWKDHVEGIAYKELKTEEEKRLYRLVQFQACVLNKFGKLRENAHKD